MSSLTAAELLPSAINSSDKPNGFNNPSIISSIPPSRSAVLIDPSKRTGSGSFNKFLRFASSGNNKEKNSSSSKKPNRNNSSNTSKSSQVSNKSDEAANNSKNPANSNNSANPSEPTVSANRPSPPQSMKSSHRVLLPAVVPGKSDSRNRDHITFSHAPNSSNTGATNITHNSDGESTEEKTTTQGHSSSSKTHSSTYTDDERKLRFAASMTPSQPFRPLQRSPSLDKKLIEQAKAAGGDAVAKENEEKSRSFCELCGVNWRPLSILLLLVSIGVIIGISIFLWYYLRTQEANKFQTQIKELCGERTNALLNTLTFAVTSLQGFSGYVSNEVVRGYPSSLAVGTTDFARYYNFSSAADSIDTVVYMPLILDAQRAAFEAATGRDISVAYCATNPTLLYNRSTCNGTVGGLPYVISRKAESSYYFPVQYLWPPLHGTVDLIMYDYGVVVGKDINGSIASGSFYASDRSATLARPGEFGILSYTPVFKDGTVHNDFAARWADLTGILLGIVPMRVLLAKAINYAQQPLETTLFDLGRDGVIPAQPLIATVNRQGDANYGHTEDIPFLFGGRSYQLQCTPSNAYLDDAYSSIPLFVAIGIGILGGIFILGFVLGILYLNMRRARSRAEQLAAANVDKNQALELLDQAKQFADQANQSKSDFLGFLCHELRNPLHAISAMVDFLHQSEMKKEDWECIETIDSQVKMMTTIVSDSLDLSKIEAGKIQMETIGFNIAHLAWQFYTHTYTIYS
jgi:hypothetical protein